MTTTKDLREAVARTIYEADPIWIAGETMDGFQMSPPGKLTWKQASDQHNEFGSLLDEVHALADSILALISQSEGEGWREIDDCPLDTLVNAVAVQVHTPGPINNFVYTAFCDDERWFIAYLGTEIPRVELFPTHWRPLPALPVSLPSST